MGDDLETRAHHGRVIINSRGLGAERAEPLAVLGARPEAFVALAPLGDVLVALPLAEGVGRSDLGERDDVDVNAIPITHAGLPAESRTSSRSPGAGSRVLESAL